MTRIRARKTLASTRVQPLQKTEHRVTRNDATRLRVGFELRTIRTGWGLRQKIADLSRQIIGVAEAKMANSRTLRFAIDVDVREQGGHA